MYTTDTTKAQTCWRCRKCGVTTPLGQDTCSNPSCQADLGIFGEQFTPGAQQEPVREEKQVDPPQHESKHQSSSNLWEEPKQEEPKKHLKAEAKQTQKASRSEKKALKKQRAEARAQEAAAQRDLYHRGPVKTFFLSVWILLVTLAAGLLAGGVMMMSFTFWGDEFYLQYSLYYPLPMLWHQIIPGVLLIALSVLFARFALREKEDRKHMLVTIVFWAIPFVIACWKRFRHNGGDSYEMLSVYLFLLFTAEPILIGSTFAGIKGLRKASSILRWIGILLLVATGILAVILSIDTYFGRIL